MRAPDAGTEHAEFTGRWQGVWQETMHAILVVERIEPQSATVVYGYGPAPSWGVQEGDWYRVTGTFDGNDLVIVSPNTGTKMRFSIQSSGTIDALATPKKGGRSTEGEFLRAPQ